MTPERPEQPLKFSEPDYAKPEFNDRAKVPFYTPDISHRLEMVPETKELLEKYSHIATDQQLEHVHKARDAAWDIRSYPCIGLGSFLTPQLCRFPIYSEIKSLLSSNHEATLLDVGTFIGHDLRRLAYDIDGGAKPSTSENLYGVDIVSYEDVAYKFFNDRERFRGKFITADILSPRGNNVELDKLRERKVDVVVISQVLHQWDWAGQVNCLKVLAGEYSKPGTLLVGNQIGNLEAQEVVNSMLKATAWRHDAESVGRMFEQVGRETGQKWVCEARLRTFGDMGWDEGDGKWMEEGVRLVEFSGRRVE